LNLISALAHKKTYGDCIVLQAKILFALLLAVAAFATLAPAQAQEAVYPNKPIRMIVPWAPGGATDVIARIIGKRLGEELGQPIVIENKAGAGGNIGTTSFVREVADG